MTTAASPLPKGQLYKPRPELFMILVLGRLLYQQLLDRVGFHRLAIVPSKAMMTDFRDRRQTRYLTSTCLAIWPCLHPQFGQVQVVKMMALQMYPRLWFLGSGRKRFSYLTSVVLIYISISHTNCLRTSSAMDLHVFGLCRYCLMLDFCCPVPELGYRRIQPFLSAQLSWRALFLRKPSYQLDFSTLWYKGMHSVGALEFFCTYNSQCNHMRCNLGNKTIFLNRLRRPDPAEASFDDSDFPQQTSGTSPQLLQDFVLQGFCKWKLWLLQVTLQCVAWLADSQCTFCLHRAVKKIGHELRAFSRRCPRPYRMQHVKHPR